MGFAFHLKSYQHYRKDEVDIYMRGGVWFGENYIDSPRKLYDIDFHRHRSSDGIIQQMGSSSGCFSIVLSTGNELILIADLIRTFPLHILYTREGIIVTENISNQKKLKLNDSIINEYIQFGFSTGSKNVYRNIRSIQAGEVVFINGDDLSSIRYFEFLPSTRHRQTKRLNEPKFFKSFNKKMVGVIDRMVRSAPNVNRWVVPLSGGHDSRILVNSLKKAGIDNVICFSYGTVGNKQSEISKQVADAVGYPWYFIEYTEEKWGQLHELGLIDEYVDFAFQGVSTPHLQDFLAVNELKENKIICENDIFIPGHTLDFITGGHFNEKDLLCTDRHKAVKRATERHLLFKDIANTINLSTFNSIFSQVEMRTGTTFQEYTNWQERQAKFIVNSCRAYEFFGFDFRLPFWDRSLVDYFLKLPPEDRLQRNLFLKSERKGVLLDELAAIPFEDELNAKDEGSKISKELKKYMPNGLKVFLLRLTGRKKKLAEGLNLIFTSKGRFVKDIIGPIEDYPAQVQLWIMPYLNRYSYQIGVKQLSALYAIGRAIDKSNN